MTRVELDEYGTVQVDLPHETAAALQAAAGQALTVAPVLGGEGFQLTAGSHVGTVVANGVEVRIRPKIPTANVLLLLTRSWTQPFLRRDVVGYDWSDLAAALVAMFAAAVTDLLRRGPQAGYIEASEDLDTIRGRIDMTAQFRRPGQLIPVPCTFSEFTLDTPANRYLKHAVRLAMRVPGVWRGTRHDLRHALAHLEGVRELPPPIDLPLRMTFTRLTRAYEPVLRLAHLVRSRIGLTDVAGAIGASSFLLDMNAVFERFVEDGLRDVLDGRLLVQGQATDHLDVDRSVQLRPDLVMRHPLTGAVAWVGDVKYKRTRDGLGRAADYYQLHAYCTRYGLGQGTLIYATDDLEDSPTRMVTTIGDGIDLWAVQVGLESSVESLSASLRRLADHVTSTAVEADVPVDPAAR